MLSKIWSMDGVVLLGSTFALVVQWLPEVPVHGSVPLFLAGSVLMLFAMTALGIFMATIAAIRAADDTRHFPASGAVGSHDAARIDARDHPGHHAGRAEHPFHHPVVGHSFPRRRAGDGLAAIPRPADYRNGPVLARAAKVPHVPELTAAGRSIERPSQARLSSTDILMLHTRASSNACHTFTIPRPATRETVGYPVNVAALPFRHLCHHPGGLLAAHPSRRRGIGGLPLRDPEPLAAVPCARPDRALHVALRLLVIIFLSKLGQASVGRRSRHATRCLR